LARLPDRRRIVRQAQTIERRGCDVCGSSRRRLLYEQRFVSFDENAGLLAGYDVVVCAGCGFLYADGLPPPAVFDRYYREMSKHEPNSDETVVEPYNRQNVDLVARHVAEHLPRRDARILDVGVGRCTTLRALRELGYTQLTGLDPSPHTAAVVQGGYGLRILNMPVSMLMSCTERFDVILLSGVLEHLRDLRPTLLLLKTLLCEHGSMCIAVPDAARFKYSVESPFQYLSVEHVNYFTKRSLQSLFAQVGMALQVSWESTALLGVFPEPIVHGVFARGEGEFALLPDGAGAENMMRYIAESRVRRDELTAMVLPLTATGQAVIVWGAGSLTMHLLSDRNFGQLNIVAFVDANANYWGKTIRGVPIIAPARVTDFEETILIVSYSYEDEIFAQIRRRYRLGNPVIRLFGTSQPGAAIRFESA
jgi:2-polyprenyl-3-methyl-5-hydroxy-6-metoxy-1,4-benzoquinol methylase